MRLLELAEKSSDKAEKTRQVFLTVAMFAHGYASIIASNGLAYDEELIAEHLEYAWNGEVLAAGQEDTE